MLCVARARTVTVIVWVPALPPIDATIGIKTANATICWMVASNSVLLIVRMELPTRPASTRPPLLATPGGVARRHLLAPAGRTNSCQKLLCPAAGPPITATAHVPVAVTREVARAPLELYEVDDSGLDRLDRAVLTAVVRRFGGGPVGLNSIAAAISEEKDAIEDIYEPFLIQIGFIDRTPRGRVATARAYNYFGLTAPGRGLW